MEYDPSLPDVVMLDVTLAASAGPMRVTLAPGTTAPVSSMTCPRKLAVCAHTGMETTNVTIRKTHSFILDFWIGCNRARLQAGIVLDSFTRRSKPSSGYR